MPMLLTEYYGAESDYENMGTGGWKYQGFQVEVPCAANEVLIKGSAGTQAAGSFELMILEGNAPDGDVIYTEEFVTLDTLEPYGSPVINTIPLATPVPLLPGVQYQLVIKAISGGASDEIRWMTSIGSDGDYPYGHLYYSNPGVGYTNRFGNFTINGDPIEGLFVLAHDATSIASTYATLNGEIATLGGGNADERGFVYSLSSQAEPGNVAPVASGYESSVPEMGDFTESPFNLPAPGLDPLTTYYVRAYAHDLDGYVYSNEVSFTTLTPTTLTGELDLVGYLVDAP